MAKDKVIAGDYTGAVVVMPSDVLWGGNKPVWIATKDGELKIDKEHVVNIGVVDENSRKSVTSAVGRAAVGAAILGPVGLAAGISAKNTKTVTLSVEFKNGKRCLIEVGNMIYKRIVTCMF